MTTVEAQISPVKPNLADYDTVAQNFSWENEYKKLNLLPDGSLNIAHVAIDRHISSTLKNHIALKWIRKDRRVMYFTYHELYELSNRFANVLGKLGVMKGDTIFTLTGRIPELYIAAIGTLKKTAVFCPLFSVFGPEPVFQRMHRGDARVLVTTSDLYEKKIEQLLNRLPQLQHVLITDVEEHVNDRILSLPRLMKEASTTFVIPPTHPDDVALLHFTSGTTGMPKGAQHVHRAVLTHLVTGRWVLDFHPEDIFWCTADPGWVTGTSYGIITPFIHGITNIVDEEEFDAARWYSILEEQSVTVWYTAPTAIRRLMRIGNQSSEQYDLKNLRLMLSVGEPLHADAVRWCQNKFRIPVLDNWWQTETGGIMISNYINLQVHPGSMGKPLPGIEAAIAAINEKDFQIISEPHKEGNLILKRGWPSMFKGYLHDEERYAKCFHGEWYITGDRAKCEEDGYFWFVGRADDIIKTSGHMVGPFEVESCLMEHPAVEEAAVIGKPEPMIGELVKAFVVIKPGIEANDELKLNIIAHARKKLGTAVAPKEIDFIPALPKTRSGKILRRLLKARELGLPEGDLSTLEKS